MYLVIKSDTSFKSTKKIMNNVAIGNFLMASTVSPFILELHILSYLVVKLQQLSCEQISPVQVTVSLLLYLYQNYITSTTETYVVVYSKFLSSFVKLCGVFYVKTFIFRCKWCCFYL